MIDYFFGDLSPFNITLSVVLLLLCLRALYISHETYKIQDKAFDVMMYYMNKLKEEFPDE